MPRLLLTLGTLALASSAYLLMLKGWRGRQRRQADLPAPPTVSERPGRGDSAAHERVQGLFVGTTDAERWLDRIAVHHLSDRASGELSVGEHGVVIDRPGLSALLLPWESIESAEVETALGGKVVTTGMLVLTWRLGARRVRSAFRADDRTAHEVLRDAVNTGLTTRINLEASR